MGTAHLPRPVRNLFTLVFAGTSRLATVIQRFAERLSACNPLKSVKSPRTCGIVESFPDTNPLSFGGMAEAMPSQSKLRGYCTVRVAVVMVTGLGSAAVAP